MKEEVKSLKYEIYKSWQSKIMHHHCGSLIILCTGRVEMRNHVGKDVRSSWPGPPYCIAATSRPILCDAMVKMDVLHVRIRA